MGAFTKAIQKFDTHAKSAMKKELGFIMAEARIYHVGVVSDWKKKPSFTIKVIQTKRYISGLLSTRGEQGKIWRYVDEGTGKYGPKKRAYYIFPKKAPRLKFQTEYLPRTKPVAKAKVGPGQAVGNWVSPVLVLHPGIKARKFTETHTDTLRAQFPKRISNAITRAI